MSKTDGNSPAFYSSGVTMRDYFAAKAMQACCTNRQTNESPNDVIAAWAYAMADAMLTERDK